LVLDAEPATGAGAARRARRIVDSLRSIRRPARRVRHPCLSGAIRVIGAAYIEPCSTVKKVALSKSFRMLDD